MSQLFLANDRCAGAFRDMDEESALFAIHRQIEHLALRPRKFTKIKVGPLQPDGSGLPLQTGIHQRRTGGKSGHCGILGLAAIDGQPPLRVQEDC